MDRAFEKYPDSDWGISDEWGRFCQLSLVPPAPRWSNWGWSTDSRLVRFNLDNIQEEEECGELRSSGEASRSVLERKLPILQELRQELIDLARSAKSKSRAQELMRGVKDKDRQIAWVEGKLRELGSDPGHFLGSMEGDRPPPPDNSQQFLGGMTTEENQPKKIPPRKRRRKGDGTGYIYHRTVTKKGKSYQEDYYHYEVYEGGDRLVKSCKYIPKGKLAQVQRLDDEKAPVREILKLLGVR